jgi:hypothetical protein
MESVSSDLLNVLELDATDQAYKGDPYALGFTPQPAVRS